MAYTYRPIRTVASAVPDKLRELDERLASLSAMTSGQVNGVSPSLRQTILSVPRLETAHVEAEDYTPGGSQGAVVARATVPVPEGRTRCHVIASVTGLVRRSEEDGPGSPPAARVRLDGDVLSPPLAAIEASRDTHLLGVFAAAVDVAGATEITVEVLVYGTGPSDGSRLSLDDQLTFTS